MLFHEDDMDATEMNKLREALDALSEAKRQDLRKPVSLGSFTMQKRRQLCRKCVSAAEADIPDAGILIRALIFRQMAEAVYGRTSGLDQKLSRLSKSLSRKLR